MTFNIGDKVIYGAYGMGEIVSIEKKIISDRSVNCYVVSLLNMIIWVPIDDQQSCLRYPTRPEEFDELYAILTSPSQQLEENRTLRRMQLIAQLKDGKIASTCRVVRDLTLCKRNAKLNDQESAILKQATQMLLLEWSYSMGVSMNQAEEAMTDLLEK